MRTIILDPGHGLSNRKAGVYDPGAVAEGIAEATVALDWANELRGILITRGHKVIRTRVNKDDPAPISIRAKLAVTYEGEIMLSLHCNAFNGTASGTETFYRSEANKVQAQCLAKAVAGILGIPNRGAKTEGSSQHSRLSVMTFQPCFLLEIGFIDNANDRAKMINLAYRRRCCNALADILAAGKSLNRETTEAG